MTDALHELGGVSGCARALRQGYRQKFLNLLTPNCLAITRTPGRPGTARASGAHLRSSNVDPLRPCPRHARADFVPQSCCLRRFLRCGLQSSAEPPCPRLYKSLSDLVGNIFRCVSDQVPRFLLHPLNLRLQLCDLAAGISKALTVSRCSLRRDLIQSPSDTRMHNGSA
jgi:hypothetical protein